MSREAQGQGRRLHWLPSAHFDSAILTAMAVKMLESTSTPDFLGRPQVVTEGERDPVLELRRVLQEEGEQEAHGFLGSRDRFVPTASCVRSSP